EYGNAPRPTFNRRWGGCSTSNLGGELPSVLTSASSLRTAVSPEPLGELDTATGLEWTLAPKLDEPGKIHRRRSVSLAEASKLDNGAEKLTRIEESPALLPFLGATLSRMRLTNFSSML
ncbi:hypothetical protein JB92DRAFT_2941745, partial [Gautieria morchelliformis]